MRLHCLSDTHEGEPHSRGLEAIGEALARAQRGDQLLCSGDLTHAGTAAQYARLLAHLPSRSGAIYLAPGNHDESTEGPLAGLTFSEEAKARFDAFRKELSAPAIGSMSLLAGTKTMVCCLDSVAATPSPADLARGRLGEKQMGHMHAAIGTAAGQRLHLVIVVHHPPTSAPLPGWRQRTEDLDGDESLELLRAIGFGAELPPLMPLSITLICGHTHGPFVEWSSPRGYPSRIYRLADAATHGRDGVLSLELGRDGWERVRSDWSGLGRRS